VDSTLVSRAESALGSLRHAILLHAAWTALGFGPARSPVCTASTGPARRR